SRSDLPRQALPAHDPSTPGPAASALSGPALSWNPHELTLRRPLAARRLPPPRRGVGDTADPRRVPGSTARRAGAGRGARAHGGAPVAGGPAVRGGAALRGGSALRRGPPVEHDPPRPPAEVAQAPHPADRPATVGPGAGAA